MERRKQYKNHFKMRREIRFTAGRFSFDTLVANNDNFYLTCIYSNKYFLPNTICLSPDFESK